METHRLREPHPRVWGGYVCGEKELRRSLQESGMQQQDEEYVFSEDISEEEYDGTYSISWRKVFYPANFQKQTRIEVWKRDIDSDCCLCGEALQGDEELSIDHKESVAEHFNEEGYLMTRQGRKIWYNDLENLVLVHAKCNSRKGSDGIHFIYDKIKKARF